MIILDVLEIISRKWVINVMYTFLQKSFKAGIIVNAVLGTVVGVLAFFGLIQISF